MPARAARGSLKAVIDTTLDATRIRTALPPTTGWHTIDVVASTGSTNADLADAAHRGEPGGRVLVAGEQTAGRGRLTRQWASPAGASVSMSMLLTPTQPAARWGWLSLLAGLAVADALGELAPAEVSVGIKWPNDVLLEAPGRHGGKVCGILSERIEHRSGARAVVGLGINLTLTEAQLPVPTATSLALMGFETSADLVVAGVLRHFARHWGAWERGESLRDVYRERCLSLHTPLTVTPTGQAPITGTGVDVDEDGCLQVQTPQGLQTFAVGDVVHARLT